MSLFSAPSRQLAAERLARGGARIYDPRERAALGAFDLVLRAASHVARLRPRRTSLDPRDAKRILAVRLDRLGDLLTTLPALQSLRAAAPHARIELAVGSWNEAVARRLPFIDAVRLVDAPWSAWGKKVSFGDARRALTGETPDIAIEFQGDVRSLLLMSFTHARLRAGYGDTGGSYLLTHRARWDEKKSWYWQNLELVRSLYPGADALFRPFNFVTEEDRDRAEIALPRTDRPTIGIHPSAGRALKQWEDGKFVALIDRLADGADVVVTGASGDRELVEKIVAGTKTKPRTLLGTDLATFAAVVDSLDVFVTGDTGPMHLSHAVGTPNVAIFGPSDPVRYGPVETEDTLRDVVRTPVFCSPCNMIRRPPKECLQAPAPECITGITVDQVLGAVTRTLSQSISSERKKPRK